VAGESSHQVIDQTSWLVHFRAGSLSADPLGSFGTDGLSMPFLVRAATVNDAGAIVACLAANRSDRALFLRTQPDVLGHLHDFLVAEDPAQNIVGCAALHYHRPDCAEILSVAVLPAAQRQGIGAVLLREAIARARRPLTSQLWLATAKPEYFARFGFTSISRFALPVPVLFAKLRQVLAQPPLRWLPALLGRFTFMVHRPEAEAA
jgi:amino-acid N-acetyltransferase